MKPRRTVSLPLPSSTNRSSIFHTHHHCKLISWFYRVSANENKKRKEAGFQLSVYINPGEFMYTSMCCLGGNDHLMKYPAVFTRVNVGGDLGDSTAFCVIL
jgi:hypothetical protein